MKRMNKEKSLPSQGHKLHAAKMIWRCQGQELFVLLLEELLITFGILLYSLYISLLVCCCALLLSVFQAQKWALYRILWELPIWGVTQPGVNGTAPLLLINISWFIPAEDQAWIFNKGLILLSLCTQSNTLLCEPTCVFQWDYWCSNVLPDMNRGKRLFPKMLNNQFGTDHTLIWQTPQSSITPYSSSFLWPLCQGFPWLLLSWDCPPEDFPSRGWGCREVWYYTLTFHQIPYGILGEEDVHTLDLQFVLSLMKMFCAYEQSSIGRQTAVVVY